jgi:hypothetical protein
MKTKTRKEIAATLLAAAEKLEEAAAREQKVSAAAPKDSMDGMLNQFTLQVAEGIKKGATKDLTSVKPVKVYKDSGPLGNSCKGIGGTTESPIEWNCFVEPDIKNKYMQLKIAYIFYKDGSRAKDDYMQFPPDYPASKVVRDCLAEMSRIMSLVQRGK